MDTGIKPKLPLKRKLIIPWTLSFIVAGLMVVMSVAGLVFSEQLYPSEELLQSFMANDLVNLVIGLPILLESLRRTRKGDWLGLLFWPGALLYTLYNYLAYVFGLPFGWATLANLAIVVLSAIALFDLLRNIDQKTVQAQLTGTVPEKIAGWLLVGIGALVFLRSVWMIATAVIDQAMLPAAETGVLFADLVISTLWVAGGALLLQRKPLGYVSGLGLLFALSMLFIGLIAFLLLQPVLTSAPLALVDILVVLVMGVICSIPFGLFMRGIMAAGSPLDT